MRFLSALGFAGAMLAATSVASADSVLFSQPGGLGSTIRSNSNTGHASFNQKLADGFSVAVGSTLTDLRFWGGRLVSGGPFLNVSSFLIAIYELDGNGLPGSTIYSQVVLPGELDATPDGLSNLHSYDYKLSSGVFLEGGVNYAFSVAAIHTDQSAFGALWSWQFAVPGSTAGASYFRDHGNTGVWEELNVDANLAFELYGFEGVIIPLPPAAWIGLATLGVMIPLRRRASKQ